MLSFWIAVIIGAVAAVIEHHTRWELHPVSAVAPPLVASVLTNGWEYTSAGVLGTPLSYEQSCTTDAFGLEFCSSDFSRPIHADNPLTPDSIGDFFLAIPVDLLTTAAAFGIVWCLYKLVGKKPPM